MADATIIPFPSPRAQLVERTGYPKWTALRDGGVVHRVFAVWFEGRRVTLESMCGRYGIPCAAEDPERLCKRCTEKGWHPVTDSAIREMFA